MATLLQEEGASAVSKEVVLVSVRTALKLCWGLVSIRMSRISCCLLYCEIYFLFLVVGFVSIGMPPNLVF